MFYISISSDRGNGVTTFRNKVEEYNSYEGHSFLQRPTMFYEMSNPANESKWKRNGTAF